MHVWWYGDILKGLDPKVYFTPGKKGYLLYAANTKSGKQVWAKHLPVRGRALVATKRLVVVSDGLTEQQLADMEFGAAPNVAKAIAELAADIRRHLTHGLVHSVTPTPGYRASKFVKRNRGPVLAGALVMIAIGAGVGATLWQASLATRAARAAEEEAEKAEMVAELMGDLFRLSDPGETLGDTVTARITSPVRAGGRHRARPRPRPISARSRAPKIRLARRQADSLMPSDSNPTTMRSL